MMGLKNKLGGIFAAICEITVGILLCIDPAGFTKGIITAAGVLIALSGVVSIIGYFRSSPADGMLDQGMARGLLAIILGIFCSAKAQWFIEVFSVVAIIYGIATLIIGALKIEAAFDMLRFKNKKWLWMGISAIVTIACAVVIMVNPFATTKVLWFFAAVSLIAEGALDFVCAILSGVKNNSLDKI